MNNELSNFDNLESDDLFEKAEELIEQKDFDSAQVLLRKSIEKNSHFVYARTTLARIYLRKNEKTRAIKLIESIISEDPLYGYGYFLLAKIHSTSGNNELAKSIIMKVPKKSTHRDLIERAIKMIQ